MLSPSLALLISIAGILIFLRLKLHPGFAIFIGGLILAFLVLPLNSIPLVMLQSLTNQQTVMLLIVIASALTMSGLMEVKGLLARLAAAMEGIGPRVAIHLVPAVIGLVPMPAGALVSATASQGLVKKLNLSPERATFINYWFRHIWEFSIPVYPAIITTSAILSVPIPDVVRTLAPMTALVIVTGAVLSYGILRKVITVRGDASKNIFRNFLLASWPILLIVLLILLRLDARIAFPLTLVILIVQQRAKWPELKKALKYGLNPKILFLLYAIMLYKAVIEGSGAAQTVFSDMQTIGLPALVILVALPFLMGFSTGFSMAFVGIALPLLVPYIGSGSDISSHALLLAYVSGMVGLLLSPLHLCLVLSAQYFNAALSRVYRYILAPALTVIAIAILIYAVS